MAIRSDAESSRDLPMVSPPPAATLTLLAPATRCNQRCPACILDQVGEPVRIFQLTESDYARLVSQFIEARVPLTSVIFQGYEVTLPASWPYVEAVFKLAQRHHIRRGFITNGMLLSKWTDRIVALDPYRIAISLDGSSPEVNDRLRGLSGAFHATLRSTETFLKSAPTFRTRVTVASCLYGESGFRSLMDMPGVLVEIGIRRWAVSAALETRSGAIQPADVRETLVDWMTRLRNRAEDHNIDFHVSDEFGWFDTDDRKLIQARSVTHPALLYRVDPLGYFRHGEEMLTPWKADETRRWIPGRNDAVDVSGYWKSAARMTT